MQRRQELLKQKKQLNSFKRTLDKGASFRSWEGAIYAKTLVQLVLIEMKLEEIKQTTRECGLGKSI